MVDSPVSTDPSRISFLSAGAVRRRPSASSDTASAYAVHANGWIPVVDHPGRVAPYLRSEKFRRKVKPTAAAAIAYAERTIWYRQHRQAEKRRRVEALAHPHYFRFLEAAE